MLNGQIEHRQRPSRKCRGDRHSHVRRDANGSSEKLNDRRQRRPQPLVPHLCFLFTPTLAATSVGHRAAIIGMPLSV